MFLVPLPNDLIGSFGARVAASLMWGEPLVDRRRCAIRISAKPRSCLDAGRSSSSRTVNKIPSLLPRIVISPGALSPVGEPERQPMVQIHSDPIL